MSEPFHRKLLFAAAVSAAPLFILFAMFVFGVPVPCQDQWELVPLLQKAHDHTLTFADLWAQHNEHRLVLPLAVMLLLAMTTGWNIFFEFLTSFALAVCILLFLLAVLRNTFSNKPPGWLVLAFSIVVFSPIQFENWLWGWQMQFFMTVLGNVVAVWSLQRWPGALKGTLIAMTAAVVATFSFSSGLFVWLTVFPMLLFGVPPNWKLVCGWCVAAMAVIGIYLRGYVKPAEHPPLGLFLEHPFELVRYVLVYLGSPLGFISLSGATVAGVVVLLVIALASHGSLKHRRDELQRLLPWLALAAQAVVSACATGIGRLGFGAEQALSSRYSTIASLLLVATLVIAARWLSSTELPAQRTARVRKVIGAGLGTLFVLAYLLTAIVGVAAMSHRSALLTVCYDEWLAYPETSADALGVLYPPERIHLIRERTEMLRELGFILPPASTGAALDH